MEIKGANYLTGRAWSRRGLIEKTMRGIHTVGEVLLPVQLVENLLLAAMRGQMNSIFHAMMTRCLHTSWYDIKVVTNISSFFEASRPVQLRAKWARLG